MIELFRVGDVGISDCAFEAITTDDPNEVFKLWSTDSVGSIHNELLLLGFAILL